MSIHWLGVDTGGTFTDFVYFDGEQIRIHKVLSTPLAPEQAILQGISELDISLLGLQLIHGSTVATNAVLEAKGVKTVYIANRGFADVLTIGRQARAELYNLMPEPRPPLIPAGCCVEINTRLSSKGDLLQGLEQGDINELLDEIEKINPQSVAINLLFSFLDARQEQELKAQLVGRFKKLFVCCSSDVLPEYKEYERGMATALNAYVGPLMQGYLARLGESIKVSDSAKAQKSNLSVLQSSGGTMQASHAAQNAVNLLLSGPAGGLKGVQYIAGLGGESRLLSFDMGGTSTDVALIDGDIKLTSEGHIGVYPVAVPMVDMHTIGAGGGSIAYVDAGGLLNVGPQSAGANPGPACYGQGAKLATVTDANLVLGRLQAEAFQKNDLGQGIVLDVVASRAALQPLAQQMQCSIEVVAEGVIQIANEHMVRALRTISVQRGYDPQSFSLACFGGAGGLHVCALADALNMRRAMVPVHGGVLSALGMLVAAPSRELSHSLIQPLLSSQLQQLEDLYQALQERGTEDMQEELNGRPQLKRSLDLRYQGQSFTLNVPWLSSLKKIQQAFNELHEQTYGHQFDMPVELVNLRLSIKGNVPPFKLPELTRNNKLIAAEEIRCYGFERAVRLYHRENLFNGEKITGPALILEKVSTTLISEGWHCWVDTWGNLLLDKREPESVA